MRTIDDLLGSSANSSRICPKWWAHPTLQFFKLLLFQLLAPQTGGAPAFKQRQEHSKAGGMDFLRPSPRQTTSVAQYI